MIDHIFLIVDPDRKGAGEHLVQPANRKIQIFGKEKRRQTGSQIVHSRERHKVHCDLIQVHVERAGKSTRRCNVQNTLKFMLIHSDLTSLEIKIAFVSIKSLISVLLVNILTFLNKQCHFD